MFILENVPLSAYSTMRLGGNAAYLTDINSRDDIAQAVAWAEERGLPFIMIGGGSNIIWTDGGFPGLVMVNKIQRLETQEISDSEQYVTAGAGMSWDAFVAYTVEQGLTGVEFLSLIPGTVGATPVQNVGAYGQEIGDTVMTIEAYDTQTHQIVLLRGSECEFGYRMSRFKSTDRGRYLITAVTFFLTKGNPIPPFYDAIQKYCQEKGIATITPQVGREATIAIRSAKLPDPAIVANNGSFFANPIVDDSVYFELQQNYTDVAHWWMPDNKHIKVSAAWLIDKAGFKDYHDPETGMATWPAQPLVLVNEHATNTGALITFREKIRQAVQSKFGITLEQEPEILGV